MLLILSSFHNFPESVWLSVTQYLLHMYILETVIMYLSFSVCVCLGSDKILRKNDQELTISSFCASADSSALRTLRPVDVCVAGAVSILPDHAGSVCAHAAAHHALSRDGCLHEKKMLTNVYGLCCFWTFGSGFGYGPQSS